MLSDLKRFGQKVKTKALIVENAVFRGDRAYVKIAPKHPGRLPYVMEFQRAGGRWSVEAIGRFDLPEYADLFPIEKPSDFVTFGTIGAST